MLIRRRYCDHADAGPWRDAIREEKCDKGFMMLFLYWICETYIVKKRKRKRTKRKSVNQYWRDFKMLYRRINGKFVDANDSNKVVKVCCCPVARLSDTNTMVEVYQ
jgi:hypothetical protein